MAGIKLIWIWLLIILSQISWAQSTKIEVKHTIFNAAEGTIDLICKPNDNQWIQHLMLNKSDCKVIIQQLGLEEGKEIALQTKTIIPIQFYGSDYQPDPIPPPSIVILWDLGVKRQIHALKESEKVLSRLLNSKILGYSQVQLIAFDTAIQYEIIYNKDAFSNLITQINNNDTLAPHTVWQQSITPKIIDENDIFVLVTDGATDTAKNVITTDTLFRQFFTRTWLSEKQIFIIGVGAQIDSTAFASITNFTLNDDEWTSEGRIPLGLAQSQTILAENAEGYVVIQCIPDAMGSLGEKPFSFSPMTINLFVEDQKYASTSVIAGSFLRPKNLMHESQNFSGFVFLVMIALGFLTIVIFLVPMRHRYKFKRDHVFIYKQIRTDEEMALDPMTLVPIEDEDVVVRLGLRIMTLKTWQSLKKKSTHPAYEDYADFFDPKYSGHLFGLQLHGTHPVQTAWFGMAGGVLAWFINELGLLQPFNIIGNLEMFLTNLESSNIVLQLPRAVWESAAITIGIFSIPVIFRNKFYRNYKLPISILLVVFTGYFLSVLLNNYLLLNEWVGGFIFWIAMGLSLAIGLSIAFGKKLLRFIPDAIILTIGGYLFFQLIGQFLLMNIWGLDLRVANLFSFLLLGWLLGQLSAGNMLLNNPKIEVEENNQDREALETVKVNSTFEI